MTRRGEDEFHMVAQMTHKKPSSDRITPLTEAKPDGGSSSSSSNSSSSEDGDDNNGRTRQRREHRKRRYHSNKESSESSSSSDVEDEMEQKRNRTRTRLMERKWIKKEGGIRTWGKRSGEEMIASCD